MTDLKTPLPEAHPEQDDEAGEATEPPTLKLDAKALTDEFAAHGLVCGVMRPDPGEPHADTVVPTAARADIVLLDWRLHDKGEHALEILEKLAAKDGLRLIAIYTSAGKLDDIAAA
ncbi:MAG: response regulator receiver domain, partial [Thermoleophilia bacterium]